MVMRFIWAQKGTSHVGHVYGHSSFQAAIETLVCSYGSMNMFMPYFKHISSRTLIILLNVYCLSTYGSCLWSLFAQCWEKFYTPWRKAVR